MTNKEELKQLLTKLATKILSTINEGLANGTLKPQFHQYFKWKVTQFEHSDTGFVKKGATGKPFLQPYWGKTTRDIFKRVSKLDVYKRALNAVSANYGVEEAIFSGHYLEMLITGVTSNILRGKASTSAEVNKFIVSFLKDLNEENQEYRAEVKLVGLAIQPRFIRLDGNVRLRQPVREDFETEFPGNFPSGHHSDPTVFLHTRLYTKGPNALQNEILKEIAVLRLFRVGAVQYTQYHMDTDSIIHSFWGTLSAGRLLGSEKYLISITDVKSLKRFWANMQKVKLPINSPDESIIEPDELSIAYDRYNDCLEASVIEKRISSAVMGLEALYLGGGEQQEMSYRLRMRVSKLLSLVNYNPGEVSERIKDAYEVRSKYVHGGTLNQKERKKLEEKYSNLTEFSRTIMDYLRASIVALLKRSSKTQLIQKIDDSFLDNKKELEIKKLLFNPIEKEVS